MPFGSLKFSPLTEKAPGKVLVRTFPGAFLNCHDFVTAIDYNLDRRTNGLKWNLIQERPFYYISDSPCTRLVKSM